MKELKQEPTAQGTDSATQPSGLKLEDGKQASSNENQTTMIIENTPFMVVKMQDGKKVITCGKFRATKTFKTFEAAEKHIKAQTIDWEMLGMFIDSVINARKEEK